MQVSLFEICKLPLRFVLLSDVQEITPHRPTVPALFAAEGRLLFSSNKSANCKLLCVGLRFTL